MKRLDDKDVMILQLRFNSLTSREQEAILMVVSGMLNKQIAAEIGTAENTVKVHRSRMMEKMQAKSLAELVKMVERLQSQPTVSAHKDDHPTKLK